MKRRQRKTVLNINGENDLSRRRWTNERQSQNGSPNNPLANFLGHYNSDSETEDDAKPVSHVLNDQVNDFLKEIQSIAPEDLNADNRNSSMPHSMSYWQECYDEQTGYPYYWHTETNQVTWEMPDELKLFHEKCQQETIIPHGSHIPQWSKISTNKFSQSQSNIPEGMIPKEVVVRNRNRQAGILNKPVTPPVKTDSCRSPGFKKDDSSDDGKIEMITSFGNDESDSDESEQEEVQKKESSSKKNLIKTSQSLKSSADSSSKGSESGDSKSQMKSNPSMVQYGPQNKEKPTEEMQTVLSNKSTVANATSAEDDILSRMKNQAKLMQYIGSKPPSPENVDEETRKMSINAEIGSNSTKELKLSLVPGYEDDSEAEEEVPNTSRKPLFPISQVDESEPKKIESSASNTRIYEYREAEPMEPEETPEEDEAKSDGDADEQSEETKSEQEYKTNKFLENIDALSKAFQRKKRIAFDVIPNKSKLTPENHESSPVVKGAGESSPNDETIERKNTDTSQEEDNDDASPTAESSVKPEVEAIKKSAPTATSVTKTTPDEDSAPKLLLNDEPELKSLTEPIIEKLKFLSEGSPATSAVQVMAIQIQTLVSAWESGDLQESYLRKWLVGTGCELTRLEQTAAPPGWECQWDRCLDTRR